MNKEQIDSLIVTEEREKKSNNRWHIYNICAAALNGGIATAIEHGYGRILPGIAAVGCSAMAGYYRAGINANKQKITNLEATIPYPDYIDVNAWHSPQREVAAIEQNHVLLPQPQADL